MLERHEREIGRWAWVMAWVGLVLGQLHALARFSVPAHSEDLTESPLVAAWAEPAIDLFSPLLTWGTPEQVYVHYGKIWFPVFLAFTLCAMVVARRRRPRGFEKWAWRAAIAVYCSATLSVFLDYWTQWTGDYEGSGVEAMLFEIGSIVMFVSLALMLVTTTVLGITLLVKGFRPRLPAVLLTLFFPLMIAITSVTSLGSGALPIMFAFGLLGRQIARSADGPARGSGEAESRHAVRTRVRPGA